ncbi:2426_t:CDS:2 [Ambispora gerdemannii]|uniref:2426_t:CDS:1 n=1 Tax=Ambispora gerdemannii TaxID=144530 RepID=A0A9N9ASS8_9GLOM|nr:2426_t:CDS:2 [Ambispora gerdemannii]
MSEKISLLSKTRKLIFHQLSQEGSKEAFADYVLVVDSKIPSKGREAFKTTLVNTCKLVIANLEKAGLECEVRRSKEDMIFIFVLCSAERLKQEIYRSRVHDWLTGVRIRDIEDDHDSGSSVLLTEGERLRLVYDVITRSKTENGAGINPGLGEFKMVNSLLPIHNKEYNRIAFYFAFLQYYCLWLIAPTIVGLFTYFFLSDYSILYAVFIVIWSTVFTEFWRRKERELSIWWGVRNFSRVEQRRPAFQQESYVVNHITGELEPYFPLWKRWLRRIIAAPVIMAFSLILASVLLLYIVLELIISEYYSGPFREQVIYLPTILYCALVPGLNIVYIKIARRLNEYENNETESNYEFNLTQKIFVTNFLVGYLSIFFIGWIHIPFNAEIGEFFQSIFDALGLSLTLKPVGPERLKNELKYFILTGQGVSLFMELILPYMTRGLAKGVHKTITTGSKILHRQNSLSVDAKGEDEEAFLRRVRKEVLLPVYDIYEDYAEMVTQYGYVSLFSVVWPLTPVLALLNNWVELRSDAIKLCVHTRRPIPSRAESIGPWLDNLALITWLSSITNPSFVYLYHPDSNAFTSSSAVLVTVALIWFTEHILGVLQLITRQCLSAFPSWADELILKEEYELKKKWLEKVVVSPVAPPECSVQKIIDDREEKGSWFWRNEKRQDIHERLEEIFQGLHFE